VLSGTAAADPVTTDLPATAIRDLAGCWRWSSADETWTFRAKGPHGLEVVREVADRSYAERARIPRDVMYDPAVGTFAFAAAGRIHALMFMFQRKGDQLVGQSYTSHRPGSYAPTGNTLALTPCH
jgi:hypothetical protein